MARILSHLQIREESDVDAMERQRQQSAEQEMQYKHDDASAMAPEGPEDEAGEAESHTPFVREGSKVGRNDPCPCGSGKKYKQCCGSLSKTA